MRAWVLIVGVLVFVQAGHASAQELRVETSHLQAGGASRADLRAWKANRPSFVAPLVVTIAGFSVGGVALLAGSISTLDDCAVLSDTACDRSIDTPFLVTATVAGGIGVLGGIWLVERLIARGTYTREVPPPQRAQLRVWPTPGGVALLGRF